MTYVKKTFRGIHANRYDMEPEEKRFALEWQNLHEHTDVLRNILCPSDHPQNRPPEVSDRDRLVAATVIQWLGSSIGQEFLHDTMNGRAPSSGKKAVFGRRSR